MRRMRWYKLGIVIAAVVGLFLLAASPAHAQSNDVSTTDLVRGINTIWVLITAFLVFFMQAGFAFLEAGATREKNTVNILIKNVIDFSIATPVFWAVGYAFMFGAGFGWIGTSGFFLHDVPERDDNLPVLAFWMFQLVFAGTSATIVSGAMAERTRFIVYFIFSIAMAALIYPIFGHWVWSEQGWLANLPLGIGFTDFAGSTVVHSVGGWAALIGTLLLGPRIGRFDPQRANEFRGHSVPLATLGTFILWLGWFGFNPGSQLAAVGSNADQIALVAANTNIAAAVGGLAALFTARWRAGTWRLTITLNGVLGGLVAITAPCNLVRPLDAVIIGAVGGFLVTMGAEWLERAHIDDPVGAVPVHLVAGVWGTLAVGLFASDIGLVHGGGFAQLTVQMIGVGACALWAGGVSLMTFLLIQRTIGLRVSAETELLGLDSAEHGEASYPRFITTNEEVASPKLRPSRQ